MSLFDLFKKKSKPTLLEDIAKTKDLIAAALNQSGYKADFSVESLKEIDRFFEEQNRPGGLLSQEIGMRLFSIGCYVGEVFIKHLGGKWIADDNDPRGEINISVELNNGGRIFPVQRAMKRFQNGSEDAIYPYAIAIIQNAESAT